MSKEMLQRKLSEDQGFGPELPPIVIETEKEKKREGGLAVLLISVGIGILAMTGTTILIYVNSFSGSIFGGVNSSGTTTTTTDSGDSLANPTTALPASFKAIAGGGNVIEDNGVTKSDWIQITGYSDGEYNPGRQCSIDSFHIYCNDSGAVSLSDLHAGKHTFTIVEPSNGETIVRAFSWMSLPS